MNINTNKSNGSKKTNTDFFRYGSSNVRNKIHTMMSAADPISQFVPFSGMFEVTLHILKRLGCVEEFIEIGSTGDKALRLRTNKNTRINENRSKRKSESDRSSGGSNGGSSGGPSGGSKGQTSTSLASRLHLLNRVFPQIGLEISEKKKKNNSFLEQEEEEEEEKVKQKKEAGKASHRLRSDTSTSDPLSSRFSSKFSSSSSSSAFCSSSEIFDQLMPIDEANELHENVRDVLLSLMEEYVRYRKGKSMVLTFDDCQWMDAWSWSLIVQLKLRVVEEKWPLLIFTATRTTTLSSQEDTEKEKKEKKEKKEQQEIDGRDGSNGSTESTGRNSSNGSTGSNGSSLLGGSSPPQSRGPNYRASSVAASSSSPLRSVSTESSSSSSSSPSSPLRQRHRPSFSSRILTLKNLHSRSVASSSSGINLLGSHDSTSKLRETSLSEHSGASSNKRRRSMSENSNSSNRMF